MPPEAIDAIGACTAMISFGIFVLVGMKMRFNHKLRLREREGGETAERLTEVVEQLHDEVRLMRQEFGELQERVDFTERMLSQGRSKNEIRPRESTPV
jgi:hypothetical protein